MGKYIQDDLKQALTEREAGRAQVRGLTDQLGQMRSTYGTALRSYDVEAASAALVKIQVLEAMVAQAEASVRQIGRGDVIRSVSVAQGDLTMARDELQAAARGVDADAFADKELRRVLATGVGEAPPYAAQAAEKIRLFVTETRKTLTEINGKLLVLNNLRQEQLNDIGSFLEQAERLADEARRLAKEAADVRQEIAKANAEFLGVAAQ